MKFTCSQQTMTKALNTVSKAVSNRTTLPATVKWDHYSRKPRTNGKLVMSASESGKTAGTVLKGKGRARYGI